MLRALGPLPSTTSSLKSSSAGYRTSSTGRGIRWISSTNRTSPSSRLVRIAARSPGRSSAGPDVGWNPTPSSFETIPASVVLPSPGGPENRRWSTVSPRAPAPSISNASCSLIRSCPTNSSIRRGRSAASNSRSSSGTSASTIRGSSVTSRITLPPSVFPNPAHPLQRLAQEVLDRAVAVRRDAGHRLAGLLGRQAEREQRLAHVRERPVDDHDLVAAELVLQVERDPLRDLLADPRHDGERLDVAGRDRPAERSGREHGQERERDLRPDAVHRDEEVEELALIRAREPIQDHRVVAHHHPRVHARRPADRRELRERGRRHEDVVADAADRDHDAAARALGDVAVEERDHRAAACRSLDCVRWQRAIATASTASGSFGRSRRPWKRSSASRTWALSAFPSPVTAIFTSSAPYSSTGSPAWAAARSATPLARATLIALTWFLFHAIRSIAT